MKTSLHLTVAGDKKRHYLTTMCSATMQNERNVAFTRQQWLRERYAVLRYTYIVSHVFKFFKQFTVTTDDRKQCVKDQQNESADSSAVCLDGSVLTSSKRIFRF